jgi:hypothetical protein
MERLTTGLDSQCSTSLLATETESLIRVSLLQWSVTMTQDNTIQVTQDDSTENYAVYESADGDTIVGMYVEQSIAETLGEFAAVTISDAESADEEATADKSKDTTNYGVFELPPAVTGMYVSHDALDSEESDEGGPVAPDSIGLELAPSDEETFEASLPDLDDQSDALVSGESDDSDEEEDDEATAEEQAEALVSGADDSSENVEIEDEEIGL